MRHIPTLFLTNSEKGRSVFTGEKLKKGDIIEACPIINIPIEERNLIHNSSLHDYYFLWPDGNLAIALGYGSLYNHSSNPNAEIICLVDENEMLVKAIKTIEAGSELTIDYTGGMDNMKIWFKEK